MVNQLIPNEPSTTIKMRKPMLVSGHIHHVPCCVVCEKKSITLWKLAEFLKTQRIWSKNPQWNGSWSTRFATQKVVKTTWDNAMNKNISEHSGLLSAHLFDSISQSSSLLCLPASSAKPSVWTRCPNSNLFDAWMKIPASRSPAQRAMSGSSTSST